MRHVRQCKKCGTHTSNARCSCGGITKQLPTLYLTKLHLDAYISLRTDGHQLFLLIQKPSGQQTIHISRHDLRT